MKVAVVGFGAIGGLIGVRLAATGCEVSAVARADAERRCPAGTGTAVWQDAQLVLEALHPGAIALAEAPTLVEVGSAGTAVVAVSAAPATAGIAAGDGSRPGGNTRLRD